jgi:hypothetical protein
MLLNVHGWPGLRQAKPAGQALLRPQHIGEVLHQEAAKFAAWSNPGASRPPLVDDLARPND